ncbi:MAG: LAGLIDADG family homing endonuclease [Candidatus Thorarchaeota archaeon]
MEIKGTDLRAYIERKYENKRNKEIGKLKESEELAELINIGLGDGSIPHDKKHFRVTLNKSQEAYYALYVYDLMFKILQRKPSIYEPREADAIKFTVATKRVVKKLIAKGLTPGDKKENQINEPDWIKYNQKFHKGGLRGLVDTDGSIHVHKQNRSIRISLKNASYPLVKDFKEICKWNGINSQKIYPVPNQNTFLLVIESKKDVSKFIYNIKPIKWEYRAKILGYNLISMKNPRKRKMVENELWKIYPGKKVHYNDEYQKYLKNLCKKYGYDVSNTSIIEEIETALTYSDNYTGLPQNKKNQLNIYANKIIDELKQRWK